MAARAPVFDTILSDYRRQVSRLEGSGPMIEALGVSMRDVGYRIPFFDRIYTLTAEKIVDDAGGVANHAVSVVLYKYLLLYNGMVPVDDTLVTYKDFKDAAPYVGGFYDTAERPIAGHFAGDVRRLETRCRRLGGLVFETDVSCQLAFQFSALPRVPVVLLFHDADEEFPAQATLLFRQDAAAYLDMECIAMVASTLAYRLQGG